MKSFRQYIVFRVGLLLCLFFLFPIWGCNEEKEPEPPPYEPPSIIGKWKLLTDFNFGSDEEVVDYSEQNITYEFTSTNKLIISSDVERIPSGTFHYEFTPFATIDYPDNLPPPPGGTLMIGEQAFQAHFYAYNLELSYQKEPGPIVQVKTFIQANKQLINDEL